MMTDCWKIEPMERPNFKQLKSRLDAFDPVKTNVFAIAKGFIKNRSQSGGAGGVS